MNKIVTSYLQKTGFRNIDLKAVLIDMDGVLYDSMPFHADAWYKAISSLGIACTPEEFFMYEGRTGASTIDLIFNRAYGRNADENEKQMIYARKCEYFVAKGVAPVMPGALDFLKQVKSHRLIPVLVTGSGQHSLLDKLSHDYPGIFTPQTMVTAFDVKYGKPDPEPYLIGLEKAGVPTLGGNRGGECAVGGAGRRCCPHFYGGCQYGAVARSRTSRCRSRLSSAGYGEAGSSF